MKPLFDSEHFSFIGDSEDEIFVNCRKCSRQARVEMAAAGNLVISVTCPDCGSHRKFTFVSFGKAAVADRSG